MFVEEVCTTRCLVLYTCGHGSDGNGQGTPKFNHLDGDGPSRAAVPGLASAGIRIELWRYSTLAHTLRTPRHTPSRSAMYSVEDLLISHGYKVSSSSSSSNNNNVVVPPSHSPSSQHSPYDQRPASRSNSRCEIGEKRTGHGGTVNGYKPDCVYVGGGGGGGGGGVRRTSSRGGPGDTESRDRKQRTAEEDNGNLGDGQSLGDSLTTDSGLPESNRGGHPQPRPERDVSYWRRRGQDFNALLDYADFRDLHGKESGLSVKAEGMQRRPESALSTEEHRRERQRRADSARARERELALYQWRIAAERKYQSLGTEEWRPAVGLSRQSSQTEGERWTQEQQRRPRTAEGAVPPRTKAKSQSLPRMAIPSDSSVQYLSTSSPAQDPYGSFRINGHQLRESHGRNLSEGEGRERWTGNGRSGVQSAPPSKPHFSRPLRPPSYEVHQQMRGSSEMLTGEFMPHARDRTPLPFSRQEYFVQEPGESGMEPPGYIPPPSYRRQPPMREGHRTYANSMGNYQYRGDLYMQGPALAKVQEWFMRQTGMAWPDHHRDGRRSMPCRRQAYPAYSEERMGSVQYIPFDDPRVRHISGGGIDGNSLTDADKIRNIRKEIPIISLSEKAPDDSAFMFTEKTYSSTEPTKSNISDCVNEAAMLKEVSKETNNTKSAPDENSNRYPSDRGFSDTFQAPLSQQSCETVTQVKKFEAQTAAENKKNKKKQKETMFCLVSVPINMMASKEPADPNNNEKVQSPMMGPTENRVTTLTSYSQDTSTVPISSEPQIESSSSLAVRNSKRAPLKKEIVDIWSLQASSDKELCYAGSWPGDQYRNQETQTGSPEVSRGLHTLSPQAHTHTTYDPPSSDTTTDSGVGTECSASFGYPMKGQKNLNLSSNSAFSRTRTDPSSPSAKSPAQVLTAQTPPSPLRKTQATKTQATDGQEVFGQFLLKPVNRRPWDAIGELESINKELQDHNIKRQDPTSIDQSIEELDEALQSILEVSSTCTEPKQSGTTSQKSIKRGIGNQLQSPEHRLKEVNLNIRSDVESRGKMEMDQEHGELRSAFSRPKGRIANSDRAQSQEMSEISVPKADTSFVSYEVLQRIHSDPRGQRLDIPVAKEALLKDVGLTVYTAIPDTVTSGSPPGLSPESPMLTSPSDNSESCEALHITSSDSGGDRSRNSPEFIMVDQMDQKSLSSQTCITAKLDHEEETDQSRPKVVTSPPRSSHIYIARRQHFRFQGNHSSAAAASNDDDDDDGYTEYLSWSNEKTLADEHLETLLSQEKANSLPTEDLSKLYKVQCAQGIPEHESLEQRAARILGISVPAESLVVGQNDDQNDVKQDEGNVDSTNETISAMHIKEEISLNEEDTQHVERSREYDKKVVESLACSHTNELTIEKEDPGIREDDTSKENPAHFSAEIHTGPAVLDLPEFPPNNLRLSLPASEDEELALSVCGGEKKTWLVDDDELSEEPQDESSEHPPFFTFSNEELSAQYITPVLEAEPGSCVSTFTKEREEEEEIEEEESVQEEEVLEGEKEQTTEIGLEASELETSEWEACAETKADDNEDVDRRSEDEQEDPKEEVLEEDSQQQPKPVKRPVPQPRSGTVAKREITLPASFNMTTALAAMEYDDNNTESVSDAYDPSRVERV
ncbi:junctional protein associated with coronary artery disease isoform X1 [Astyanax mexicanus]|uniref:junctional protein associated with coronary artery disease isoform X1 n=2 Tax=Astyanax mexicanus TaxID=7994 RepID=UPI0020CAFB6C|nr:junctional protein associated with coronary artery disease isoform X1 [Astyanax mexicanus]